jgi:hypothetical protein
MIEASEIIIRLGPLGHDAAERPLPRTPAVRTNGSEADQ